MCVGDTAWGKDREGEEGPGGQLEKVQHLLQAPHPCILLSKQPSDVG